jgi:VanZ family protein
VKNFLKYWLPVLIWLAVIFAGSTDILSAPHTSRLLIPFLRWLDPNISFAMLESIQLVIRKFGHLIEYAILAALLWRAFGAGTNLSARMSILFVAVWIVCAVFAATDEFHQSFVPSRTAAFGDVMIDTGGSLVALMICWMFGRKKSRVAANRQSKI